MKKFPGRSTFMAPGSDRGCRWAVPRRHVAERERVGAWLALGISHQRAGRYLCSDCGAVPRHLKAAATKSRGSTMAACCSFPLLSRVSSCRCPWGGNSIGRFGCSSFSLARRCSSWRSSPMSMRSRGEGGMPFSMPSSWAPQFSKGPDRRSALFLHRAVLSVLFALPSGRVERNAAGRRSCRRFYRT